jgi:hypothetical protein
MIPINDNAPVKIEKRIEIEVPLEIVWEILTDINKWSEWNPNVKKAKLKGELLSGTSFDWIRDGAKITSTIHTIEPFRLFGWSGKAFGSYGIHNWKLENKNGTTEVISVESMEGLLMNIFRGFMKNNLETYMINWLNSLKREAEDQYYNV